jgi:uncharacterized protein
MDRSEKKAATVYYKKIDSYADTDLINSASRDLLARIIDENSIVLAEKVPLKVHFGERGNSTFIGPENLHGIIDYLEEHGIDSSFIETNAVYSGKRKNEVDHIRLAHTHGFTRLPIEIADGERGHEYDDVRIDQKFFSVCKIASGFATYKQLIVISHFKGHRLAGYGGALKQLAMGFASRGGKFQQHADTKPLVVPLLCRKCRACMAYCPVNAIQSNWLSAYINKSHCIGCASCIAVCPYNAIFFNILKLNLAHTFSAKMAEYALAAQLGRTIIYITFAFNITKHCDCEGHAMQPVARDFGILASLDPVAIDRAALDIVDRNEKRHVFKGRNILEHAQKIGLGNQDYKLCQW